MQQWTVQESKIHVHALDHIKDTRQGSSAATRGPHMLREIQSVSRVAVTTHRCF